MYRFTVAAASLAAIGLIAGCGANTQPPPQMTGFFGPEPAPQSGTVFGDNGLVFGVGKGVNRKSDQNGGAGLGVNAYLWRGALDTLSFMPIASADPFGGTIITDWYSPPSVTNERFKVNVFIFGRELRSDAVRISVFRQELEDGRWVDAPVSDVTVSDIDNRILDRARQLRAQIASQ
ncbi:MAG TPA: DUF3576 domain-containing protein [Acetobacteraceae bacterium]|nr:DUF3576 domain-containing protein [Acetobacteraceae bacterium]